MAKKGKLRPFRVDYFDVQEMTEGDLALVRSKIVRAVTKAGAKGELMLERQQEPSAPLQSRFIINCERFYRQLSDEPKKKVYKSVESLLGEKKALKVMDAVEAFRTATTGTPFTPVADNTTEAKLNSPAAVPLSGPSSPATQAVLTDLAGMTEHDAHEKTMDTFQPETGRLPENLVSKLDALDHAADSGDDIAQAILSNEPLPAPTAVEVCTDPACNVPYGEHIHVDETRNGLPAYEWCPKHPGHYKLNCTSCKIEAAGGIENLKDQIAGYVPGSSRGEPATDGLVLTTEAPPPAAWRKTLPLPTWAKLAIFSGIAALVLVIILSILGHPCH